MIQRLLHRLGLAKELSVWHDASYWLPVSVTGRPSHEPRRADFVAWYLTSHYPAEIIVAAPEKISYQALQLVHSQVYLESLNQPEVIAHIFGVEGVHIPTNDLLQSMRVACGATLAAARAALETKKPTLNLLGGFHHAAPDKGSGFCIFNDMAVAIAKLRAEGFAGRVAVLDFDAHPPDGSAECFQDDPEVWLGSLSGSYWKPLPNIDETLLPKGCNDALYLTALDQLLQRMPEVSLAFVIAGGDVLLHDRLGLLGLTIEGARQRDIMVADKLKGVPSVWLPGGGYHPNAWKLLTGTALVLLGHESHWIPEEYHPITERFSAIASKLSFPKNTDWLELTQQDLDGSLQKQPMKTERLLNFYTKEGVEYALVQYGFWDRLEQLGYTQLRLEFETVALGERLNIWGQHHGEHHLVDCVISLQKVAEQSAIFIHWLQLRHPIAKKTTIPKHGLLPGQDAPGLGLSREVGELFRQLSKRLGAAGVALCPAWYHVAFSSRQDFYFLDAARQGRFEALLRDLGHLPTKEVSLAIAEERVFCHGEPYQWEATEMVSWVTYSDEEKQIREESKERCHFTIMQPNPSTKDIASD
jgi:acetoin utilization deacetylase AcuC-like enzyme